MKAVEALRPRVTFDNRHNSPVYPSHCPTNFLGSRVFSALPSFLSSCRQRSIRAVLARRAPAEPASGQSTGSAIGQLNHSRRVKAHRMQQRQHIQAFEGVLPLWLRHHASRRRRSGPPLAIHAVHLMLRSPPPKRGRRGPRGPAGSSTLPPRHARTADGRERSLAAPWSPPARDAEESASAPPTTHL